MENAEQNKPGMVLNKHRAPFPLGIKGRTPPEEGAEVHDPQKQRSWDGAEKLKLTRELVSETREHPTK